jgi:hypothetical protein
MNTTDYKMGGSIWALILVSKPGHLVNLAAPGPPGWGHDRET